MDPTAQSVEDLEKLPPEDRVAAVSELVAELEKRLEATGLEPERSDSHEEEREAT